MLRESVRCMKMIGPKRADSLKRLGIETLFDLLYHFPRDYYDRSLSIPFYKYHDGQQATIKARVMGHEELRPRRGLRVVKVMMDDGAGIFQAVWYNQTHVIKQLPPGTSVIVSGKIKRRYGSNQLMVADYEVESGERTPLHTGRIVPVYPLTEGINSRLMRSVIKEVLGKERLNIREFLPRELLGRYRLPGLSEALGEIHFPSSMEKALRAKKRFIFEEFFIFQMSLAFRRRRLNTIRKPHRYSKDGPLTDGFLKILPFTLTGDQKNVWREIKSDMDGPAPVNRLLHGDVGSGKTIICVLAMLRAVESGFQGALMAPTEILAEQHFRTIKKYLDTLNIEVGFLHGGMTKRDRSMLLQRIALGEVQIVVGTHALIQNDVGFRHLAVAVIDEQHRFGVRQRAFLQQKGYHPDVLVMSATPIPRTLALTLYGDLDISVIRELPPGRQPVRTVCLAPGELTRAFNLILNQIQRGRQAYIVCPLVEESEKIDIQAAVELFSDISSGFFGKCRVGLIHGRMKPAEKEAVMNSFGSGATDILVSTTVVEVGMDVPNATVMLIMDAHRFGLAQLHQLRGRVGRGANKSYCILISGSESREARARLDAMVETNDGFRLAERDLEIRGPGEFTGTRQWGLPQFKVADIIRDWRALEIARIEAERLLDGDPELAAPGFSLLKRELAERLKITGGYWDIG